MPYIKPEGRVYLETYDYSGCSPSVARDAGELNYTISVLLREYLYTHGLKYATINDIIGALEAAKLEFYRRMVAPYEDTKIEENGDVY